MQLSQTPSDTCPNPSRTEPLWDRLSAAGLFAFIPLTLILMLGLPLGEGPSLLLAAAIIAGHRPVASRFVYNRRHRRCLWCGSAVGEPVAVRLTGVPDLQVCSTEAGLLARFLSFCARHRHALRIGILFPVFGYFLLGALSAMGLELLPLDARKDLFRGLIALSVVGVALLYRLGSRRWPQGFPFPIHNLALLGVRWTLWIFLAVGLYWLFLSTKALLAVFNAL